MRLLRSARVSAVLALLALLATPARVAAECFPIPNDIWSLPVELIVYMFWVNFPNEMQEAAYLLGTYDPWPLICWVIEHLCAWQG